MDTVSNLIGSINSIVWGAPMLIIIVGVGLFLTIGLSLLPLRKIGRGFVLMWQGRTSKGTGDISAFHALMTSLSATIGTGNIAGVATAIVLGGPGAVFWMWITALVGMATKYSEAVCAVHFRETDSTGKHIGGPMYYIKNGLSPKWKWLAGVFAAMGAIAAFGIGNMVQSNSIADALDDHNIYPLATSIILFVLISMVLLGGITRIAVWAGKLVPFMTILYVASCLIILVINYAEIPAALQLIVTTAFTGTAATGGFAGAAVAAAIQFGIARGVFSNEAGLGSAPIAHAAARTKDPITQGHIAMLGTFIDTIIICSMTALVIITTGAWSSGETGVDLTAMAFDSALMGGHYIVIFSLVIFAFTTILGWSYYGEKCWQYLFGVKRVAIYRVAWIAAVFIGPWALTWKETARAGIDLIWLIADTLNAAMALPNLIALVLLAPIVIRLTREYYDKQSVGESATEPT